MNIFNQWGQYLKFALPSMLGVCVECWYYEIATVAIGILGNTQLAVMSIIKQISEIIFMVHAIDMILKLTFDIYKGSNGYIFSSHDTSREFFRSRAAYHFSEDVCGSSWICRLNKWCLISWLSACIFNSACFICYWYFPVINEGIYWKTFHKWQVSMECVELLFAKYHM